MKNIVVLGTSFNPSFFGREYDKFIVTWEKIDAREYFGFKAIEDLSVIINDTLPRKAFYKYMEKILPQTFVYNTDVEKFIHNRYTWKLGDDIIMFKPKIKIKPYNIESVIENDDLFSFYKMNVITDKEMIDMVV